MKKIFSYNLNTRNFFVVSMYGEWKQVQIENVKNIDTSFLNVKENLF